MAKEKAEISKRKFYKTVIIVEILSEKPNYEPVSLHSLSDDISTGDCSGSWTVKKQTVLNGKQMAKALEKQGSDPEFFNLTEKGEDIE